MEEEKEKNREEGEQQGAPTEKLNLIQMLLKASNASPSCLFLSSETENRTVLISLNSGNNLQ